MIIVNFKEFLKEKETSINELYKDGAKNYFGMACYNSRDYITKQYIKEEIEEIFDQFPEQPGINDIIEEYCNGDGIDYTTLVNEIENTMKSEIVDYLNNNIEEIAESANEEV